MVTLYKNLTPKNAASRMGVAMRRSNVSSTHGKEL